MAAAFDQLLFASNTASGSQSAGFVQNCAALGAVPQNEYIYVFCCDGFSDGLPAVTDAAGNSYSQVFGGVVNNGTPYLFRAKAATSLGSGQNVIITWGANTTYRLALIWAASGIDLTTPLDTKNATFTDAGFGNTAFSTVSITPAVGSIMFGMASCDVDPVTLGTSGPFTMIGQARSSDAVGFTIGAGYLLVTSSVGTTETFTRSVNTSPDVAAFSDKQSTGGGPVEPATVAPPQHLGFGTVQSGVTGG